MTEYNKAQDQAYISLHEVVVHPHEEPKDAASVRPRVTEITVR
jgi:hypothetical protein